jgi:thiamine-phosphate pyrophosphorylase
MMLPRLYPILDTGALAKCGCPLETAAEAMLEGGAGILQLRQKGHFTRGLFEQAERIGALCRRFGAMWIVDDRADMALLLDAGLHVGQDDLPPKEARRLIGAGRILGFSTHNDVQLRAAAEEPVDYVALGPVFETGSKEEPDPVVGVDGLHQWRSLTERPLVAIGGITRTNAVSVLEAGADSVAVIGDLLPPTATRESLRARMEEWQLLVKR